MGNPRYTEDSQTTDSQNVLDGQSQVLLDDDHAGWRGEDETWREREGRNELKHVAGLGELEDVTEVEYRKVRLEKVVLVGVWSSRESTFAQAEESLRELAALAETAGAEVCDGVLQQRSRPDGTSYVGSGKAREIADIVAANDADTIIVDADLPPSQRRALEDLTHVKVVDRTAVILDIFAQHATSREGKAEADLLRKAGATTEAREEMLWRGALDRLRLPAERISSRWLGAEALMLASAPYSTTKALADNLQLQTVKRLLPDIAKLSSDEALSEAVDGVKEVFEDAVYEVAKDAIEVLRAYAQVDKAVSGKADLPMLSVLQSVREHIATMSS